MNDRHLPIEGISASFYYFQYPALAAGGLNNTIQNSASGAVKSQKSRPANNIRWKEKSLITLQAVKEHLNDGVELTISSRGSVKHKYTISNDSLCGLETGTITRPLPQCLRCINLCYNKQSYYLMIVFESAASVHTTLLLRSDLNDTDTRRWKEILQKQLDFVKYWSRLDLYRITAEQPVHMKVTLALGISWLAIFKFFPKTLPVLWKKIRLEDILSVNLEPVERGQKMSCIITVQEGRYPMTYKIISGRSDEISSVIDSKQRGISFIYLSSSSDGGSSTTYLYDVRGPPRIPCLSDLYLHAGSALSHLTKVHNWDIEQVINPDMESIPPPKPHVKKTSTVQDIYIDRPTYIKMGKQLKGPKRPTTLQLIPFTAGDPFGIIKPTSLLKSPDQISFPTLSYFPEVTDNEELWMGRSFDDVTQLKTEHVEFGPDDITQLKTEHVEFGPDDITQLKTEHVEFGPDDITQLKAKHVEFGQVETSKLKTEQVDFFLGEHSTDQLDKPTSPTQYCRGRCSQVKLTMEDENKLSEPLPHLFRSMTDLDYYYSEKQRMKKMMMDWSVQKGVTLRPNGMFTMANISCVDLPRDRQDTGVSKIDFFDMNNVAFPLKNLDEEEKKEVLRWIENIVNGKKGLFKSCLYTECFEGNCDNFEKDGNDNILRRRQDAEHCRARRRRTSSMIYGYWSATNICRTLDKVLRNKPPLPDTLCLSRPVRKELCMRLYTSTLNNMQYDWRALASEIGMTAESVSVIECCLQNQPLQHTAAEIVLRHWQFIYNKFWPADKRKCPLPCTKQQLQQILSDKLGRRDLVELIASDVGSPVPPAQWRRSGTEASDEESLPSTAGMDQANVFETGNDVSSETALKQCMHEMNDLNMSVPPPSSLNCNLNIKPHVSPKPRNYFHRNSDLQIFQSLERSDV